MLSLPIKAEDLVEDVVRDFPKASSFMRIHGVVCVQCGEPIWGTMGEAIARKGKDVEALMAALNTHLGASG